MLQFIFISPPSPPLACWLLEQLYLSYRKKNGWSASQSGLSGVSTYLKNSIELKFNLIIKMNFFYVE